MIFMRKIFILALVVVLTLSCSVFAETAKVGLLTKSNLEEAQFKSDAYSVTKWAIRNQKDEVFTYYDDLLTMLLALNAGDIDELDLPKVVAEYIVTRNPDLKISCVACIEPEIHFAFGFKKDNPELCKKFNEALSEMRKDETLRKLQEEYLRYAGKTEPTPVKFDFFPDSETISIAVTGDLPPLDYTSEDGAAAGFNTAILAEIGRRLNVNIRIITVNSVARVAALMSGRADGVFWFMLNNFDLPENIIASEPYYTFDEFLHIRKK